MFQVHTPDCVNGYGSVTVHDIINCVRTTVPAYTFGTDFHNANRTNFVCAQRIFNITFIVGLIWDNLGNIFDDTAYLDP